MQTIPFPVSAAGFPHQFQQGVCELLENALDQALLIANTRGDVLFATRKTRIILQTLFADYCDSAIPSEIRTWLVSGDTSKPAIAGCGGWSKRKTLFGGDQYSGREDSLLDPALDAAKIRAFFVHPAWARQGVGTLILDACENAARAAGFTRFEMGATLTGVKLFGVKGYVPVKRMDVPLDNGEALPIVQMEKRDPVTTKG